MKVQTRAGAGGSLVLILMLSACADASAPSAPASAAMSADPAESHDEIVVADGEAWIAYQWVDGSGDGIFLVRPDGTGHHQLAPDLEGSEIHPDWSPDGKRLAFVRITLEDRSELWMIGADGSGAEMLWSCDLPCNTIGYPDWAGADPGGIYYGQDANAPADGPPTTFMVGRFDLATGEAGVVLTREDGSTAAQPRISPDGRQVAYTRGRDIHDDRAGQAIFVADLEGGPERQLTEWDLFGTHPDWTTDGQVLFHTYDLICGTCTEPSNLYTVALDGSDLQQLTTFGDHDTRATQSRVTPDGTGIVFTQVDDGGRTRRLAYINVDGTGMRWLTPEPIDGTHPQLRPLTAE